mmetsp:Transcript_43627/g.52308  ORF Transcript_43627/g.52308 Transcript_43627/m.52308 type:complete len:90 (+) Transcript_43627:446-715(+)
MSARSPSLELLVKRTKKESKLKQSFVLYLPLSVFVTQLAFVTQSNDFWHIANRARREKQGKFSLYLAKGILPHDLFDHCLCQRLLGCAD